MIRAPNERKADEACEVISEAEMTAGWDI